MNTDKFKIGPFLMLAAAVAVGIIAANFVSAFMAKRQANALRDAAALLDEENDEAMDEIDARPGSYDELG